MSSPHHDDPWRRVHHLYSRFASRVHADVHLVADQVDEERASLEEALRAVVASLDALAQTSATALRDPRLHQDFVRVLAAARDAVRATVAEVRTPVPHQLTITRRGAQS